MVLAVGWKVSPAGQKYYIVENSWGNMWVTKATFKLPLSQEKDYAVSKRPALTLSLIEKSNGF